MLYHWLGEEAEAALLPRLICRGEEIDTSAIEPGGVIWLPDGVKPEECRWEPRC